MRALQIHVAIVASLRKQMPMFGRAKAQKKLLDQLQDEFVKVQRTYGLPAGDFPDPARCQQCCPSTEALATLRARADALWRHAPVLID